jgi:predicted metal-binding protein
MTKIGILACKKMMDTICIGCGKCFKALAEGAGMFADYETPELVFLTSCGDCPGFPVQRTGLLLSYLKPFDQDVEVIHLGTCIKSAVVAGKCPIDIQAAKKNLEEKFKKTVVVGTHPYPP